MNKKIKIKIKYEFNNMSMDFYFSLNFFLVFNL